jgi:amidohydrolase
VTAVAPSALPAPRAAVQAIADDLVAVRRDLHRHAELSNEETRTQGVITDRLRSLAVDDVRAVADTGVTGLVRGSKAGPNLLWRADMDGLPLKEETGLPFACEDDEAMHACGHDGHVAIALALAELLQASRDSLAGTVRFAFQPAEERIGGAKRMVDEGILNEPSVDRVFGLHIISDYPTGHVRIVSGAIFAAATHFRIIVRGRGGHASAPQATVDPIVAAAHAIVGLQTVVSRSVDPRETAVLTIGRLEGGKRGNIIPESVLMSGSIRTFEQAVLDRVLERMDAVLRGVGVAFGAEVQFDHSTLPAVVNDPECAAVVERAAASFLGPERVGEARLTGSDDMAYFQVERPGAFFLLGGGKPAYPHHHPKFDFDEACLVPGVEVALRVIEAASESTLG